MVFKKARVRLLFVSADLPAHAMGLPLDIKFLDLKIPPPIVGGVIGALMWAIAPIGPSLGLSVAWVNGLTLALVLAGFCIDLYCAVCFVRAKTTVNPLNPNNSSVLVTGGAYRLSRNPMYVGQALVVLGWAVFLNSAWGLLGPVAVVLYLNRFQIGPEERILKKTFGEEFDAYAQRVRRWL